MISWDYWTLTGCLPWKMLTMTGRNSPEVQGCSVIPKVMHGAHNSMGLAVAKMAYHVNYLGRVHINCLLIHFTDFIFFNQAFMVISENLNCWASFTVWLSLALGSYSLLWGFFFSLFSLTLATWFKAFVLPENLVAGAFTITKSCGSCC